MILSVVFLVLALYFFCALTIAKTVYDSVFKVRNNIFRKKSVENDREKLIFKRNEDFISSFRCSEITINSVDGVPLVARLFTRKSNDWTVLCHGFCGNGANMSVIAEYFYNLGYNVLIPDAYGHGSSGGKYRGMGHRDSLDLRLWTEYIVKIDGLAKIVLFGMSMGGSTVLTYSGREPIENVVAVISDSGFASIKGEMSATIKKRMRIGGKILLDFVSLVAYLMTGYSFAEKNSAINAVKHSDVPTLFIHGTRDEVVPFEMMGKMFKACSAKKERKIIIGAGHTAGSVYAAEEYFGAINGFLVRTGVDGMRRKDFSASNVFADNPEKIKGVQYSGNLGAEAEPIAEKYS